MLMNHFELNVIKDLALFCFPYSHAQWHKYLFNDCDYLHQPSIL